MAHNKKKNKYPVKNSRPRHDGPIKVKLGAYDGSTSSDDFVVSGHSSGSQNSEMDEISRQMSRDLGQVPDYPIEFSRKAKKFDDEYDGYEGEGLGDLGGPEFYGKKPTLLKKSPVHFVNEARRLSIGTSLAALAGSAVLAGIAYAIYRNVKSSDNSRPSAAASQASREAATRNRVTPSSRAKATKSPKARGARKATARTSTSKRQQRQQRPSAEAH